jgi:hypothetical protein
MQANGILINCAMLLQLCVETGKAAPQFTVRDLGPGSATFISDSGQILGIDGQNSPWFWNNERLVELGLDGYAVAVNHGGCVVGGVYSGYYQGPFGDFVPSTARISGPTVY